jgi:serine/threonine-protein phosphatase 2A regulatory subunit A
MPLIIQAAEDKSWRVRICLSRNFTLIAANFGKEVTDMSLIQTFGNLLKDSEVDVKIEAVKHLSEFAKIISPEKVSVLVPQVIALGKDQLAIVRSYMGGVLTNILPFIAKDQIYQAIQPLIKDLMKDDNQEVRKGGILAAAKLVEVLGPESMPSIEANLKTSLEDPKWRVRLEAVKALINLALKMKNPELFKKLEPLITSYLKDRASAIRVAAIERIQELVKVYGSAWVNTFIERLGDILSKDPCFHFKLAAIYTIREIIYANDQYLEKGLGLIFQASSENVPNVREACVKA